MLDEICDYLSNYFCDNDEDRHFGNFKIKEGSIALPFLKTGQYFRIIGSTFNDGIYMYPTSDLQDEEFDGAVWALAIPKSFLRLVSEIEDYVKNPASAPSPYTSESFNGYSYSKATGKNGGPITWQEQFAERLNSYMKI